MRHIQNRVAATVGSSELSALHWSVVNLDLLFKCVDLIKRRSGLPRLRPSLKREPRALVTKSTSDHLV